MNEPALSGKWLLGALEPKQVLALIDPLAQIYQAVFRLPPYEKGPGELEDFSRSLEQHVNEPGFQFVIGRSAADGTPAGFCYGRHGGPGQLWYDLAAEPLKQAGLGHWLVNVFQVCEFAVHPAHQGKGLGGMLLDQLLRATDRRRAVLATLAHETTASHLYQRRGWKILLSTIDVPGAGTPGAGRPYKLLGLA